MVCDAKRLLRCSAAVSACAMASLWAAPVAADPGPGLFSPDTLQVTGDIRLVGIDGEPGWVDAAFGKLRSGSSGDFRVQPEHGGIIERCDPPSGAQEVALAALAAAPAPALYARVDIVVGNCGTLQVMELELIEPALWLDRSPNAATLFADAVLSAAGRLDEQPLADR